MGKHYQGILAACLIILFGIGPAQASIVANAALTTDTATGLDWLDHSLTAGMSLDQAYAQQGIGGLFEGWQGATLGQVHT